MNLKKYFHFCVLIISLLTLISGINTFWKGFHNVDLFQNFRWLQENVNKRLEIYHITGDYQLTDLFSDGKTRDLSEGLNIGFNQLQKGFFILIIGAFLSGFMLHVIYSTKYK